MAIVDEALKRINCFGIGAWIEATLQSLNQPMPPKSLKPDAFHSVQRASGLVCIFSRIATPTADPRDAFVLARVEGDATAAMPLGLDPATETLTSAAGKLSTTIAGGNPSDIAKGDRRVSFFLDGGRVVELRFNANMKGFDRILIARLGEILDWRDPQNQR